MRFTKSPLPYLVALLLATAIGVSSIAPQSISLNPYGPTPNPYQVAR
jgi:hypothetical protein